MIEIINRLLGLGADAVYLHWWGLKEEKWDAFLCEADKKNATYLQSNSDGDE